MRLRPIRYDARAGRRARQGDIHCQRSGLLGQSAPIERINLAHVRSCIRVNNHTGLVCLGVAVQQAMGMLWRNRSRAATGQTTVLALTGPQADDGQGCHQAAIALAYHNRSKTKREWVNCIVQSERTAPLAGLW